MTCKCKFQKIKVTLNGTQYILFKLVHEYFMFNCQKPKMTPFYLLFFLFFCAQDNIMNKQTSRNCKAQL